MKKQKTKNLSKAQLKKLKGGLIVCNVTRCEGDTCGMQGSAHHCSGENAGNGNTVSITSGGSTSSTPKTKR